MQSGQEFKSSCNCMLRSAAEGVRRQTNTTRSSTVLDRKRQHPRVGMALRLAQASAYLRRTPAHPLRARASVSRLDLVSNRAGAGTHTSPASSLASIFQRTSVASIVCDRRTAPVLAVLHPSSSRCSSLYPRSFIRSFATPAIATPSQIPSTGAPSQQSKPEQPRNNIYWRARFGLAKRMSLWDTNSSNSIPQ